MKVDLEGVTFSLEASGEEYIARKDSLEAEEFYLDPFSGGVSIAPENHEGETSYACIDLPPEAAETLANTILDVLEEGEW